MSAAGKQPYFIGRKGAQYLNYVEPIRNPETVKDIGDYLKEKDEKLFVMYSIGIYSGLRISDILDYDFFKLYSEELKKRREGYNEKT